MTAQTDSSPQTGAHSVEREIVIAAPVEEVWKALTDAEELVRWFPLEAKVTPGPDGSILMRWDGKSEFERGRIQIWEPNRHLRTMDEAGTWVGIATDYYLGGRGGSTVLRVVSSGFAGENWEETLDSFGLGWDFELRGLRHYLEHHRGQARLVGRALARYTDEGTAWDRLTGPGGLFGPEGWTARVPGAEVRAHGPGGEIIKGEAQLWQPPKQLAATIETWSDSWFRLQLYGGTAAVWLATWGLPDSSVRALEEGWRKALSHLLSR
jgi:uncharacterized protein YndB with AHSA1/START domain